MFSTQNIHTTSTSSARSWLVGATMAASIAAFGMFALSAEASNVSRLEAQRAIFSELQEVRTMQQQIIQSRDFSNVDTFRNRVGSISGVLGQVQSNTSPDATFDISPLGSGAGSADVAPPQFDPGPEQEPAPDSETRAVNNLSVSVTGRDAVVTFDAPTPCHGYMIEWGDGSETGQLDQLDSELACMQVVEPVEESHQYTATGEYTVVVTVDGGQQSEEVVTVDRAIENTSSSHGDVAVTYSRHLQQVISRIEELRDRIAVLDERVRQTEEAASFAQIDERASVAQAYIERAQRIEQQGSTAMASRSVHNAQAQLDQLERHVDRMEQNLQESSADSPLLESQLEQVMAVYDGVRDRFSDAQQREVEEMEQLADTYIQSGDTRAGSVIEDLEGTVMGAVVRRVEDPYDCVYLAQTALRMAVGAESEDTNFDITSTGQVTAEDTLQLLHMAEGSIPISAEARALFSDCDPAHRLDRTSDSRGLMSR